MSTPKTDDKKDIKENGPGNTIALEGLEKSEVQPKDFKHNMEHVSSKDKPKKFFRILAEDEKKMLTTDASGFLINMMNIESIDSLIFEKVIHISMQIYSFTRKKINREMITDILNMIVFSGKDELSLRDFLEVFGNPDADYEIQEDIN